MQNIQILYGVPVMFVVSFWVIVVKNGCGLLDQGILKSAITQESFDEMSNTNLGKINVNLIIIGWVCSKQGGTF